MIRLKSFSQKDLLMKKDEAFREGVIVKAKATLLI